MRLWYERPASAGAGCAFFFNGDVLRVAAGSSACRCSPGYRLSYVDDVHPAPSPQTRFPGRMSPARLFPAVRPPSPALRLAATTGTLAPPVMFLLMSIRSAHRDRCALRRHGRCAGCLPPSRGGGFFAGELTAGGWPTGRDPCRVWFIGGRLHVVHDEFDPVPFEEFRRTACDRADVMASGRRTCGAPGCATAKARAWISCSSSATRVGSSTVKVHPLYDHPDRAPDYCRRAHRTGRSCVPATSPTSER